MKPIGEDKEKPFFNRSLERAFRIHNAFSSPKPFPSPTQLSEAPNLPRATVLRLCAILIEFGLLRQDQLTNQYSLGIRMLEPENSASYSLMLMRTASSYLEMLQAKPGKTTFFEVLDNDEVLYTDKRDDPR